MIPMVEEVDKIVYNLLAGEQAVYIPSVGSLLVERVAARRLSKRRVVPPYFAVIFTSHTVGTSLIDAIAQAAECDAAAAQEVFVRWLARAMQNGVLTIGGVGVLRQKSFSIAPTFDKIINRHDRTPRTVRPSQSHWLFWTAASVAIVCGIGACVWILYDRRAEENLFDPAMHRTQSVVTPITEKVDSVVTDLSGAAFADADSTAPSTDQVGTSGQTNTAAAGQTPASVQPITGNSLTPQPMTTGRNYVVLGVFSTEQNAQRAAQEAMAADPALRCGVWNFGAKFLTSLFVSDDATACANFINAHLDRYPEAWSYKAK